MEITFQKYQPQDIETLVSFLASEKWHFHVQSECSPEETKARAEQQYYDGLGIETFWIVSKLDEKVGFVRIYDLDDEIPLFDLRIAEKMRGQGIGTKALEWLKKYIFESNSIIIRVEGYTRRDNLGMRKVFRKAGFVKESQPRACWPDEEGTLHDSVGYGITRKDWETGSSTAVDWEEE